MAPLRYYESTVASDGSQSTALSDGTSAEVISNGIITSVQSNTNPAVVTSTGSTSCLVTDAEFPYCCNSLNSVYSAPFFSGYAQYSNSLATGSFIRSMAWSVWLKIDSYPSSTTSFTRLGSDDDEDNFGLRVLSDGRVEFIHYYSLGTRIQEQSSQVLNLGEWNHIAYSARVDNQAGSFVLNGVEQNLQSQILFEFRSNASSIRVGPFNRLWNSDVRIAEWWYNHSITDSAYLDFTDPTVLAQFRDTDGFAVKPEGTLLNATYRYTGEIVDGEVVGQSPSSPELRVLGPEGSFTVNTDSPCRCSIE